MKTMKNLPLNNKLADFDSNDSNFNPETEWNHYYKNWIKIIEQHRAFLSVVLLLIK